MIVKLKKTIPSNSHNAPFNAEHGSHWPEGQRFKLLPPARQRSIRAFYNHCIRPGCTVVEQIGGEEVLVVIDNAKFRELFGIDAPAWS